MEIIWHWTHLIFIFFFLELILFIETIVASMLEHYGTNPSAAGIWIPCVNNSPRPIIVRYCLIFYHVIPGLIFDLIFKLMGNKIR